MWHVQGHSDCLIMSSFFHQLSLFYQLRVRPCLSCVWKAERDKTSSWSKWRKWEFKSVIKVGIQRQIWGSRTSSPRKRHSSWDLKDEREPTGRSEGEGHSKEKWHHRQTDGGIKCHRASRTAIHLLWRVARASSRQRGWRGRSQGAQGGPGRSRWRAWTWFCVQWGDI